MKIIKKTAVVLALVLLTTSLNIEAAQAKVNKYTLNTEVTMTGKLKKVLKPLDSDEVSVNCVLYPDKLFVLKNRKKVLKKQNRIVVVGKSYKKMKKYLNKKIRVTGYLSKTLPKKAYCTKYCIDISDTDRSGLVCKAEIKTVK